MKNSIKSDKYQWIRDIIYTNVVAKLRGKSFANILDIRTNTGSLLEKLSTVFPESRLYGFSKEKNKETQQFRLINTIEELRKTNYDLILSVFDIHKLNLLQVSDFLDNLSNLSDSNTTILLSDITSTNFLSSTLLKAAYLFNPRLKTVLSLDKITEYLTDKKFEIIEKDIYKINNVWAGWIITCKLGQKAE